MAPVAPFALTEKAARPGRAARTGFGLGLLLLASCASPLDAPSAFTGERFLCEEKDASEWAARIQDCRASFALDGSCPGLISFRGVLDSQSVVVDSPVTRLTVTDTLRPGGIITRDLFLSGLSPYFRFSFDFPAFNDPGNSKSGFVAPGDCILHPNEPCFAGVLNLEARGGTLLLRVSTLLQNVRVDTAEELRVNFSGDIASGGALSGCFDLNLAAPP